MNATLVEPLTACPGCFGRGYHQLVPWEEPLECSRCLGAGNVTLEHAFRIREEARAFVEKALREVERRSDGTASS